jgi:hypothetical protein
MKTSYSRRELYAFGEPIGESSTYELAGRRVYGGGGGGLGGIIGDTVGAIGDLGQGAIDTVGDVGKSIDQTVRDVVPGGWTTAALLAGGYAYDPTMGGFLGPSGEMVPASQVADLGAVASPVTTGSVTSSVLPSLDAGLGAAGTAGGISSLAAPSALDALGGDMVTGAMEGVAPSLASTLPAGITAEQLAAEEAAAKASMEGITADQVGTGAASAAGAGLGLGAGAAGAGLLGSGLSLGGGLLGAAGLAGLMDYLKADNSRFGTPGRQDISGSMGQFKYDPSKFAATTPDPAMFRAQGVPTAKVGYASGGGISALGGYSDGGRMLKGPGDGMSDSIPATIGHKRPARLADGEFVVPADVVSHLGNGSTDAGAKRLYAMMDKVRQARTGNKKQGKEIKADKYMPK